MKLAFESRQATRLQDFDYGQPGVYFVTICTHDRHPWFGEVRESAMVKSSMGEVAERIWHAIPVHFRNVRLDEFCVMPDHVHGLLEIMDPSVPDERTQNFASLRTASGNQFGPQSRNLAAIIRGYKIGVTKILRDMDPSFRWQPRYWDHVIRTAEECDRIRRYIHDNPKRWRESTGNQPYRP